MIIWLKHASFIIQYKKTIYIDPYELKKESSPADIILITHTHFEHFSINDIQKIISNNTIIISNEQVINLINNALPKLKNQEQLKIISANEKINISGIDIEAVSAYTIEEPYHQQKNNGLGFIVNISGKRIYHAGDTGVIPEMFNILNCDVALLPVSGKDVMSSDEAVRAAVIIKPKLAIPMHYGFINGTIEDANRFCYLANKRGIPSKLLTPQ